MLPLDRFLNLLQKKPPLEPTQKYCVGLKKINMPIVAIGGINSSNYKKILSNGANFIACSSYIWDNKGIDPVTAIKKFQIKNENIRKRN